MLEVSKYPFQPAAITKNDPPLVRFTLQFIQIFESPNKSDLVEVNDLRKMVLLQAIVDTTALDP